MPAWMLIGAACGIIAGATFGERMAILHPVGAAYAMMLQMAVYPYLISTLVHALGRLTPEMGRHLFSASWPAYLFLWCVTLGSIWILSFAIPPTPLPTVLGTQQPQAQTTFLDLIIPSNLFIAFDQNYVPAIVVFAIVYGLAIQKAPQKAALFEVLQAIQVASVTIWGWIVRVAPIGVFSLFAATAGTVQPDRIAGMLLYLSLFMAGTLILALVVLPAAMSSVTDVSYRTILHELRPAIVLALVTTLSVSALPFIQKAAERMADRAGCPDDEERANIIRISLSLSYVLAQLGNYFVYLLMLYAAFAYQVKLNTFEQVTLPLWTLLSGLGSPTATVAGVSFVGRWLGMPPDVQQFYLETWTITRYGQVLLSVTGFGFGTLVVTLIYFRRLKWNPRRGMVAIAAGLGLLGCVAAVGVALRPWLLISGGSQLLGLTLDPELKNGLEVTVVHPGMPDTTTPRATEPTLVAIMRAGVLRVGYHPDNMPFSYINSGGELVGYDIAVAYRLARDLNVRLELLPFTWRGVRDDLLARRFDIAMSGLYSTNSRLKELTLSLSYMRVPMAMILPAAQAQDFLAHRTLDTKAALRLAVFDDDVTEQLVQIRFPNAMITIVPNYDDLPALLDKVDGAVWTLPQASAWAATHPGYSVVRSAWTVPPLALSYMMQPSADGMRHYIDQWLELRSNDGFQEALADYWLNGKPRRSSKARWNLFDAYWGS